jgi:2-methylcitrate dehydratase PrpD
MLPCFCYYRISGERGNQLVNTEEQIAKYIANLAYEDLPIDVVDSTKKFIVDTLGVAIAGSNYSICDRIADQARSWGGKEESTVLVYGDRVPCHHAAMANATMARALDFGGVYEKTATHPNETVIPVALALAEREKASGEDVIIAVTLGIDLTCRLKGAVKKTRGFVGESVFGGSAVTARILKLDEGETLNALGIAYCLLAGTYQMVLENVSYLHLCHGMRSATGILSGFFAQQGVTGPRDFLEGDYGLYNTYENREDCDPSELIRDLGERFESVNVSIKPYPTCKFTHAAIYCTLELMSEQKVRPGDVDEITVGLNHLAYQLTGAPKDEKRRPQQPIEAQFSIPYLVGTAVINRDVLIEHVTESHWLNKPDILKMAERVKCHIDNEVEREYCDTGSMGAKVTIRTREGNTFEKRIDAVIGHPDNPLSFDQVVEKFRKCVLHAARPLPQTNIEEAIDMLSNLEQVRDFSGLCGLLA